MMNPKVKTAKLVNGDELLLLNPQVKDGVLKAKSPMALAFNPQNGNMQFAPYIYTAKDSIDQIEFETQMTNVVVLVETDQQIIDEYLKIIGVDQPVIQLNS